MDYLGQQVSPVLPLEWLLSPVLPGTETPKVDNGLCAPGGLVPGAPGVCWSYLERLHELSGSHGQLRHQPIRLKGRPGTIRSRWATLGAPSLHGVIPPFNNSGRAGRCQSKTGEQIGEQSDPVAVDGECFRGVQRIIRLTPAHHHLKTTGFILRWFFCDRDPVRPHDRG